jgi:hypothetical protein
MFRIIPLLTLVLAMNSVAAKPTFQSALQKFPPAILPITIKERTEQKAKLTLAEAEALGIFRDASPQLAFLREAKLKSAANEKRVLRPLALIPRTGYQLLLLAHDFEGGLFVDRRVFLLSYDEKGVLLGGVLFHRDSGSSEGSESNVSTLDQIGVVSRLITEKHAISGNGMDEPLIVVAEDRAKLTSSGAFEVMPRAWKNRKGRYIDRKTNEELIVDKGVLYRANKDQPLQQLEGEGNTFRFKGAAKPYVFTWNDRRSDISCENPDGAVQVFSREW